MQKFERIYQHYLYKETSKLSADDECIFIMHETASLQNVLIKQNFGDVFNMTSSGFADILYIKRITNFKAKNWTSYEESILFTKIWILLETCD